jgi:hypothetical protein
MNKGFSMIEALVASTLAAIVMISLTDFSFNVLKVADIHAEQVQKTEELRYSSEMLGEKISQAAYIFPQDNTITMETDQEHYYGNTYNQAVGVLVPALESDANDNEYTVYVFFLATEDWSSEVYDLYEFTSKYYYVWEPNTNPTFSGMRFHGSVTKIAENINLEESTLNYDISKYKNGITDSILIGDKAGATPSSYDALIDGIDWKLVINDGEKDYTLNIREMAKNVPRIL